MKRLDEIEPRSGIAGGNNGFVISQPGSYYLAGNISVSTGDAISVTVDNVSLDLNGYTLSSTSATPSGHGVYLTGSGNRSQVSIFNGHIRSGCTVSGTAISNGPGFVSGIDYTGNPTNVRVHGVTVTGVKSWGIDLGYDTSSTVQACVVRISGAIGIHAGAISDSSATQCLGTAINGTSVANSVGSLLTGGTGIVSQSSALLDSRTPITTAPFTISASGSYYLARDLAVGPTDPGITISASNVTLDLNGHSIVSSGGAVGVNNAGVSISGSLQNIRVLNGNIMGATTFSGGSFTKAGFAYGIFSNPSQQVLVENINVSQVSSGGITFAAGGFVRSCTVQISAQLGISASTVQGCSVSSCANTAIAGDVVENCEADSLGYIGGAPAVSGGAVSNCRVSGHSDGDGISGFSVLNCFATSENGIAIGATTVSNSTGRSLTSDGINCSVAMNCSGSTNNTPGAHGISARAVASYCVGSTTGTSAYSLTTPLAIGCSAAGTNQITARYLMP